MYACILENGRVFFRGGVRTPQRERPFLRPTPTDSRIDSSDASRSKTERGESQPLASRLGHSR